MGAAPPPGAGRGPPPSSLRPVDAARPPARRTRPSGLGRLRSAATATTTAGENKNKSPPFETARRKNGGSGRRLPALRASVSR